MDLTARGLRSRHPRFSGNAADVRFAVGAAPPAGPTAIGSARCVRGPRSGVGTQLGCRRTTYASAVRVARISGALEPVARGEAGGGPPGPRPPGPPAPGG